MRRIGPLVVALCLVLAAGCATRESTEDFQAIDSHQSAEATLAAIMDRFEHGDVTAVKHVMTGHLIVNEEADGGFLEDPPKVVSYTMIGSPTPPPADGAAQGHPEVVALNVHYKTTGALSGTKPSTTPGPSSRVVTSGSSPRSWEWVAPDRTSRRRDFSA